MADVFISYAREDQGFVRTLCDALKVQGRDAWVDWSEISPTVEWLSEIFAGIESASVFVFLISPESSISVVCHQEVAHAVEHHKRIIPILHRAIDETAPLPEVLRRKNWIDLPASADLSVRLPELLQAIETDWEWVKQHKRYTSRAVEWRDKSRDSSLLLRGADLTNAESWLALGRGSTAGNDHRPTQLQTDYIATSRLSANRFLRKLLIGTSVALVVVAVFGIIAYFQRQEADRQRSAAVKARDDEKEQRLLVQEREAEQRKLLHDASMADSSAAMQRIEGADRWHEGVAHLTRALEWEPGNRIAATWLYSTLAHRAPEQQSWPRRVFKHRARVVKAFFNPDGSRVLTIYVDRAGLDEKDELNLFGKVEPEDAPEDEHAARLWDTASGQPFGEALRHAGEVSSAQFSPDGSRIATASDDGTVKIWDTTSGSVLAVMKHKGDVHSVRFSPDGTRILTASSDATACLWDAKSGERIGQPLKHGKSVHSAEFGPDGASILTVSQGKTATLWDTATQKVRRTLKHDKDIQKAIFSPDGTRVVVLGEAMAFIWESASARRLEQPLQHDSQIYDIKFSPDGARIATASLDGTAQLWDATSGARIGDPMRHRASVTGVGFSPDGTRLATASEDGTARVWDVSDDEKVTAIGTSFYHRGAVGSAVFSADGRQILTASADFTARIWDAPTNLPMGEPLRQHGEVYDVGFDRTGTRIVTGGGARPPNQGSVRIYDTATGQLRHEFVQDSDSILRASFTTDESRVVTLGDRSWVWELQSDKPLVEPFDYDFSRSDGFSPNGSYLLTLHANPSKKPPEDEASPVKAEEPVPDADYSSDAAPPQESNKIMGYTNGEEEYYNVRLQDAVSRNTICPDIVHEKPVNHAGFSPDDSRLYTLSDGTVRLWQSQSGKALGEPLKHKDPITIVLFDATGAQLFTFSEKAIHAWDAITGKATGRQYQGFESSLSSKERRNLRLSKDNSRLLVVGSDETRVWDLASAKFLGPALYHYQTTDAEFSPDAAMVVTASMHHTACVWDIASGRLLMGHLIHDHQVSEAEFSPDGALLVTGCGDGSARLWHVEPMLHPPLPVPRWFRQYAQAIVGIKFKPDGEMEEIPLHERLDAISHPPAGDDAWSRLARWLAQPSYERKLNPDSAFTRREIAERERDFGSMNSLKSAVRYDPSIPLARLSLAGAISRETVRTLQPAEAKRQTVLRQFDLDRLGQDPALWGRAIRSLHEQKERALADKALAKLTQLAPDQAARLKAELGL
jgi:WD40 repeat protein